MSNTVQQLQEEARSVNAPETEISNCGSNIPCLEKLINKYRSQPIDRQESKPTVKHRNRRR
jgi:hypothetical protein